MPADFRASAGCAIRLLLNQRLYSLRIDVLKLKYDKLIIFDTLSHYCSTTRATLDELTAHTDLRDGCTLNVLGPDGTLHIVLYNESTFNPGRRSFTLAHEVGHIYLEHQNDTHNNEAEANCFASTLLMPPVITYDATINVNTSNAML